MTCDDVRSRVIDSLVTRRALSDPAVLAHIESCPACRAAQVDYANLWEELGARDTPQPSSDAASRFARRLATSHLDTSAAPRGITRRWWVGPAVAAGLVAILLAYRVGTLQPERSAPDGDRAAGAQPTFLLLLHVDSAFRRGEPAVAPGVLVAEYQAWAKDLGTGAFVDGERLAEDHLIWLGSPHAATAQNDHVDGFFLIHAKDWMAARAIAASCPHLKHGGRIEVREIDQS